MEKKIIAVALVLVLMVTVFVGCSKKLETIKVNGMDIVPATDKEGNTIINDDFNIAFYVTDANNKLVTDENGEPQTNWLQINDTLSGEDVIVAEDYRFNIPEGWSSNGWKMEKDKTEGKCYIQRVLISEITDEINFQTYSEVMEKQNNEAKELLEKEGCKVQIEKGETTITLKQIPCVNYLFKVVDKDGKLVHYSENYFYIEDNNIYVIEYTCLDGVGYDEEFDFWAYLNRNFVTR